MFGEYAQIATYLPSSRDSSGAGDFPAGSLPPHLLPPPSVSQPLWAGGGVSRRGRGPDFTEDRSLGDFIMVAEFSEIEGPKPVVSVSFLSKNLIWFSGRVFFSFSGELCFGSRVHRIWRSQTSGEQLLSLEFEEFVSVAVFSELEIVPKQWWAIFFILKTLFQWHLQSSQKLDGTPGHQWCMHEHFLSLADFVLVTEFSEIECPEPVLSIFFLWQTLLH